MPVATRLSASQMVACNLAAVANPLAAPVLALLLARPLTGADVQRFSIADAVTTLDTLNWLERENFVTVDAADSTYRFEAAAVQERVARLQLAVRQLDAQIARGPWRSYACAQCNYEADELAAVSLIHNGAVSCPRCTRELDERTHSVDVLERERAALQHVLTSPCGCCPSSCSAHQCASRAPR